MTERQVTATQFDLRKLQGAEVLLEKVWPAADVAVTGEDYRIVSDVRFTGFVRKLDETRFTVQGTVRATLELNCSRCLEPLTWPVDVPVELTYVPEAAAAEDTPDAELQDEDFSTAYYRDHVLDLGEMLREQFNLALPMRPLCQEACKGLCPQCGTNLNRETCGCDVKWEDPRLAGLRSLLERKEHNA